MIPQGLYDSIGGDRHKWWALGTVGLGTFMSTLNSSIVNVALPSILKDLSSTLATISWVVLAYLLTLTALLLAVGRLSDLLGRKRVYTTGFGIFIVGSLFCGVAGSPAQLILARVCQAAGAAMLQANGLAITGAVFPTEERGRAVGINGTIVATGITSGSAIGGLLVGAFGWRSVFLVNIPIGLLGIALALLVLDEERISFRRGGARQGFDPAGALVLSVALITLLLGLNQGQERGWGSPPIVALLTVAALGFGAFIALERRVASPLIDLALFRIRAFSAGALAAFLSFLAVSANTFLMPFFLQLVLGYSPARAGLLLTPTSLTQAAIAPFSGWLSDRVGARILSSVGLSITALALVLLGRLPAGASYPTIVLRLMLLGAGNAVFNSPNTSAIMGAIPRENYGLVGGFVSMIRNCGQVVGVALATTVLLGVVSPVVGAAGLSALRAGAVGADHDTLIAVFLAGFQRAYVVAATLAAGGVLVSLGRGRRRAVPHPAVARPPTGTDAAPLTAGKEIAD